MKTFASRLLDLLQRFEECREHGPAPDPAAFCADSPDLRAAFTEALTHLDRFRQRYEDDPSTLNDGSVPPNGALPEVPGFDLEALLGRGGMGVVYRARERAVDRVVAIKMILAGPLAGPTLLARFQREAIAVARLRHAGIVQLLHVGQWAAVDGSCGPFMVLEYLPGGSLADALKGQPLPGPVAAGLIRDLARALQHAHEQGVLHRDLKPANILLLRPWSPASPDPPVVKVADFGLVRLLDETTRAAGVTHPGMILGTPSYMAPEQAAGDGPAMGTAVDVWALGTLLYECLTGRPPFRGTSPVETLRLIREQEPVPPRALNPTVARDLETICLKCLCKEPEKRYVSAQALADDLDCYRDGRPIHARPVGTLERTVRWCRRNALVTVLAIAVFLTLLTGTAVAGYLAYRADLKAADALREASRADSSAADARRETAVARTAQRAATFEAERATQAQHALQVDLAYRSWQANDLWEAERALERMAVPLRAAWESRHLADLCQRRARTLIGHKQRVNAAALLPDGRIATGSNDRLIKIWNAVTGTEIATLRGHARPVVALAVSGDGKTLVSADSDYGNKTPEIKVWDLASGTERATLRGPTDRITTLAVSADGATIAAASWDRTVRIWDGRTGQERHVLHGHTNVVAGVTLSRDGKTLLSASWDGTVREWDPVAGRAVRLLGRLPTRCHQLQLAGDGSLLVVAAGDPGKAGTVSVWEFPSGHELLVLRGPTQPFRCLALSADGKTLSAGNADARVHVWDLPTGRERAPLHGCFSEVTSVTISADGRRVGAICAQANGPEAARVWDLEATQEVARIRSPDAGIQVAALNGAATLLATAAHTGTVRLWNLPGGVAPTILNGHTVPVRAVALDRSGQLVASGGGNFTTGAEIYVRATATGRQHFSVHVPGEDLRALALTPDGSTVVATTQKGDQPGHVRVWDIASARETLTRTWNVTQIGAVAVSPDGTLLAAAGGEIVRSGDVKVWERTSGREIVTLAPHRGLVQALAFSPDGTRLATACQDTTLAVWEIATGARLLHFKAHNDGLHGVVYSPDGRRLASVGFGQIKLWDATTGQEKLVLSGHKDFVWALGFSPDGRRLISASQDRTIRVWDAPPARVE